MGRQRIRAKPRDSRSVTNPGHDPELSRKPALLPSVCCGPDASVEISCLRLESGVELASSSSSSSCNSGLIQPYPEEKAL